MKRIGILGGTFNPIHIGHLAMAETARDRCRLDRVLFVPCSRPPHKNIRNLIAAQHRFQMVRLAIKGNPYFEVSDFEVNKGGKSYTIDTVNYFHRIFPKGTNLFFIVGGDNLQTLSTWKDIKDVLKIVTFIVLNRPGHPINRSAAIRHISVPMPDIGVSASYIRRCRQEGRSVKYFVPDPVLEYMDQQRLYRIGKRKA